MRLLARGLAPSRLAPSRLVPSRLAAAPRLLCAGQRCRSVSTLPVLDSPADVLSRFRAAVPERTAADTLAFYSSDLKGIVTDPSLMLLPVDDHGFHRGHAVFDTCNVEDGRAFGLTMHLDRLLRSALQARVLDSSGASEELREELRDIVLQTIAATGRRNSVFVRYWLTVGRGDFGIAPTNLTGGTSFYCVVHKDNHSADEPRGVTACVVPTPLKPPFLATMKTNNYLLNAHVAMDAHAMGCHLGVQLEDGYLAESAVSTIAIVDQAGVLRSPPAERILDSTTWRRALVLAEPLLADGTLTAIDSASHISEADLRSAREILNCGGGWLSPVIALDGAPVSGGEPGPVFRALDPAIRADFVHADMSEPVPYNYKVLRS